MHNPHAVLSRILIDHLLAVIKKLLQKSGIKVVASVTDMGNSRLFCNLTVVARPAAALSGTPDHSAGGPKADSRHTGRIHLRGPCSHLRSSV